MEEMPPLRRPPGYKDPKLPVQRPPRNADLPPTLRPYRKSNCCRNCCLCICISIILLALFSLCFLLFLYFWIDPKLPKFNIKSFQLDNFNVSSSNGNEKPKLSSKITVKIEFKNTNKNMKVVYDKISISAKGEGGLKLGKQTVPGFIQGKKNNNVTTVKFVIKENQKLKSEQEAKKLMNKFKSKSLKVTMEVTTGVGMALSGQKAAPVGIKGICGDTTLKQIQDGSAKKCKVSMVRR